MALGSCGFWVLVTDHAKERAKDKELKTRDLTTKDSKN
jgi:hypothetical protein